MTEHPYYIEDPHNREARLTRLFSASFFEKVLSFAGFHMPAILITEWDKSRYGRRGDVDIAAFQIDEAGVVLESAAFEVKVSQYIGSGRYKSLKPFKHLEQVGRLKEEGWEQVSLLDVVVTDPYPGWISPYVLDIKDSFPKEAGDPEVGHYLLIKTSVLGRDEEDAGGHSSVLLQQGKGFGLPNRNELLRQAESYLQSLGLIYPSFGYIVHDLLLRKSLPNPVIRLLNPNMLFPYPVKATIPTQSHPS